MTLSSALGKYTAKTIKFFRLKETNVSWLVATWTVETYLFAVSIYIILLTGSIVLPLTMLAFYGYSSYALFSVINN